MGLYRDKSGVKMTKIKTSFIYFSSRNIYQSACKREQTIGRGKMIYKLTLKTNTMSIFITIWGLWVPVSSKSVGKIRNNRIFSYISSLNIYKSTCKYGMNNPL